MTDITFRQLTEKFLASVKIHQEPRTLEYYEGYIQKFLAHLGDAADLPADGMKPYQVNEWTDSHPKWSDNYKRGAVVAINRCYNWAIKEGRIENNPIKTAFKPPAQSRKAYAKPDDYTAIIAAIKPDDPFLDFVIFAWASGARPQECRHIEPRHVDLKNQRIIFPAKESKGKRQPRRILLNKTTMPIIERLMEKYSDGKIFRNNRGEAWEKYAICSRFANISEITGKKVTAYGLRHGYVTRKLKDGVGHMQLASAVGHTDGSMIARVYSHVHEDEDHIRAELGD